MDIRMLGAARMVTGSCFEVKTQGHVFAVDCGMHQGGRQAEERNLNTAFYEPDKWEFILLSHAHIDHSGLLPRMVKYGFRGPIYMTAPTEALLKIMLLDSAHIQEMEAQWKTLRMKRHGERKSVESLYTTDDAIKVFNLFKTVEYGETFSPSPGISVTYRDSGHILGSAFIEIETPQGDKILKVVFSGDVGRPAQLIVKDPSPLKKADFIFMESTYGDRNHKDEDASLDELAEAVMHACRHGEKVIIPAFAVERTQEIIYCFHLLYRQKRIPEDLPIFVDSPLAIQATEVFRRFSSYFDDETKDLIARGYDPLSMPNLRYTLSTEESMTINSFAGPAVVISASGMADAGRIKHHLKHNLWREGASIVFVGYQAQGTTGRRIVDGASKVRIFGEEVAVKAKVFTINGFSAHAGQAQLIDWLKTVEDKPMHVFLVHGEYNAQQCLAQEIERRLNFPVSIPEYGQVLSLMAGKEPVCTVAPRGVMEVAPWVEELSEMERIIYDLKTSFAPSEPEAKRRLQELKQKVERLLEQG